MPEILIHRGLQLAMTETPLDYYLNRLAKHKRPKMVWCTTACWRRYIGTWEIRDDYLTLVGLQTMIDVDGRGVAANLDTALPWVNGCLRATWLNAMVRCPEGRMLRYVHQSYQSAYERDRWFGVSKGRVEEEFIQVNPPPPLIYRIDAKERRQCVDGFRDIEGLPDPLAGRPLTDAYLVWGQKPQENPEEKEEHRIGGKFRLAR